MKTSNNLIYNQSLKKVKLKHKISFFLLFLAVNFYSLLVPIRIFTTNTLYTGIEIILLFSMVGMIIVNLLTKPSLIVKYGFEISFFYIIIILSLLGTLIMRTNVEFTLLIRYLRYLYTPFIFSILILTSELSITKLYKKRKYLFIPVVSLFIAIISSIIQLVNPSLIRELMFRNELYHELSRSTNFLRGSIHNRIIGIFNDPNLFGAFLVLNIILIVLYLDTKNELKKSIKYIIPMIILVMFTISRSSIFILIICCFIFFICKIDFKRLKPISAIKKTLVFLLVLAVLAGVVICIFSSLDMSISALISSRFSWNGFDDFISLNNRTAKWKDYIDMFSHNYLAIFFGVESKNLLATYGPIENALLGINLKYGILIFLLIITYITNLLSKCKFNLTEKLVLISFLILISIVSDIDTFLFITVPLFSYLTLSYKIN